MNCPKCKHLDTKVSDSRVTCSGRNVRRRRQCLSCGYRFTTIEQIKLLDIMVKKRNNRVVPFSEKKLEEGIRKSFNKRQVEDSKLDKILQEVIDDILSLNQNIIDSSKIGELVSNKLKKYDKVAYICFLAVYGNFETIQDFNRLLQQVK